MKRLTQKELLLCQKRGCFDEHLVVLNAATFGDAYIYEDAYMLYHDSLTKTLWLTLFELRDSKPSISRYDCVNAAIAEFKPVKIKLSTPEKLRQDIGDYHCENTFSDRDYQIRLEDFDEGLRGGAYQSLRSRINNAVKRGYKFTVGKEITSAHSCLMASHITKREYQLWDLQLFLKLENFIEKSQTAKLLNVFLNDMLVGFDVSDSMGEILAVPLGFYLDCPSLTDFMMFKEVKYAKEQNYSRLDIGWACSPGVEEFKKKWKGNPKFSIYVQEYVHSDREKK